MRPGSPYWRVAATCSAALAQRRRWGRRLGAAEPLQELEARVGTQDGLPQGGRQPAGVQSEAEASSETGLPQGGRPLADDQPSRPPEQPAVLVPADQDTQVGVAAITH